MDVSAFPPHTDFARNYIRKAHLRNHICLKVDAGSGYADPEPEKTPTGQSQVDVRYDSHCLTSNDSLNSCSPKACCSESASSDSAVGDLPTALAAASQLLSQSKLRTSAEQIHVELVDNQMKQREEVRNDFCQTAVPKQSDIDKRRELDSKTHSENTQFKLEQAKSTNRSFGQFLSNGNQLLHREDACLDIPSYLDNSNRPLGMNNPSNCHFDMPLFNTLEDSQHRRHLLCSVSSDPEMYTKSPSVEKLNSKIQKLRDDMLALRNTTLSYKQYMERLFDELQAIATMHDNSSAPEKWEIPSTNQTPVQQCRIDGEHSSTSRVLFINDHEGNTNCRSSEACAKSLLTSHCDPTINSALLPSYEDVLEARLSLNCKTANHSVSQSDNPIRKSKVSERPYSDPFVTCTANPETIYSESDHPNSKIPTKYSVKSADSSLESESKRCRGKNGHNRIFAVMSKPNATLHISECSIDSGYQGSFITSPKDRIVGRELGSQAQTPLSINESALNAVLTQSMSSRQRKTNHSTTQNDSADPCTNNDSSKVIENAKSFEENKKQQRLLNLCLDQNSPAIPNMDKNVKVSSADPPAHPAKLKCIEENHLFIDNVNLNQDQALSLQSRELKVSSNVMSRRRPVPKQRTVFATTKNQASKTAPAERPKDLRIPGFESIIPEECNGKRLRNTFSDHCEATDVAQNNMETPISTTLFPLQCLTVIKPSPVETPIDIGSPVQSRVKLGVSAIKQLAPDIEKLDGSSFNCALTASQQVSDAKSRMRKTANAKQLLREKFAAAVESSSIAAAKATPTEPDVDESEWSVVRRRSMRMMTEFQIFDCKDGSAVKSQKSAAHRRNGGRMIALQKQKQKSSSPVHVRSNAHNRPDNTYSVSSSAAQVSKEKFETKVEPSPSRPKAEISIPKGRKVEDVPATYAGEPLPPPPPTPPRSPNDLDESLSVSCSLSTSNTNLTGSIDDYSSKNTEVVAKYPAFVAPLIRPKVSHPEIYSNEPATSKTQKATFYGLKLSPHSKSAFKPVLNLGNSDGGQKPVDAIPKISPPNQSKDLASAEIQHHVAMSQIALSNKQRFLKEFMPDATNRYFGDLQSREETELVPAFQRHASWRKPRRKTESAKQNASAKTASASSCNVADHVGKTENQPDTSNCSVGFATTEPLYCELPKNDSSISHEGKRRRHTSGSKAKASSDHHPSLEDQPVRFDKSDKMADVIGALKTAGYLHSNEIGQSFSKVSHSSSFAGKKKLLKEDNTNLAPAPLRESFTTHQVLEPKGHIQTCYKARSSTSLHQYETVKLIDDARNDSSSKHKNRKHGSKDVFADDCAKASRSHKSTIALIRASLLGKRDKPPRNTTAETKRDQPATSHKVRSSSVGDKLKVNDEFIFESKHSSKSKAKEGKSKKSKSDSKTKEKSSNKHNSRDQKKEKGNVVPAPIEEPFVFPDTSRTGHGNPDAEVMERFLAAAAAAASNSPRSPLQRLRSSFRTPKHKNRLQQEARIRDDMDISKNYRVDIQIRNKSNIHNGQEFTYV